MNSASYFRRIATLKLALRKGFACAEAVGFLEITFITDPAYWLISSRLYTILFKLVSARTALLASQILAASFGGQMDLL